MESSNKNSEIIRLPGPTKRWGAKCFFQSMYIYIQLQCRDDICLDLHFG